MNIPPGYAQVNIRMTGIAVPRGAETVFGIGPLDVAVTPTGAAQAIGNYFTDTILEQMSQNVTLSSVRVKRGPNETGPEATVGFANNGGASSPPDAPQVAVLVRKTALLGGRANRGRMFLPGLAEDQTNSGGLITAAARTVWQAKVTEFLGLLTSSNLKMVILHNSEELTPTLVTDLEVQQLVATQRRRLRKVGGRRRRAL